MIKTKIKSELAEGKEPIEGETYKIDTIKEVTTAVQSFVGIRVEMTNTNKKDTNKYTTMLWNRPEASEKSKLGAFMFAFKHTNIKGIDATETDTWIGHNVQIISWKNKNREVKVTS